MNENLDQDLAIIANLRKQNKENGNVTDEAYLANKKDIELLEKTLRLEQWSEQTLKLLKKKKTKFKISILKSGMAAGIAIILTLSYLIFDKNFISDIILTENVLRGTNSAAEIEEPPLQKQAYLDFLEGKGSYHAKEYPRAIAFYKKALEVPMLRNQLREAIEWHLCVAYLMNSQAEECEKLLEKIENNSDPKYEINSIDMMKLKTQLWLKK
jgi:hypothetical protein